MQDTFALDLGALSSFDMAVLRFTPAGECIFANLAAEALLGSPDAVGLTLDELFPDAAERAVLSAELNRRLRGHASSYRTEFTRPLSKERVPISVFAFPERGADGGVAGSIAIVRDLREEETARAIHAAIETLRTDQEILSSVAQHLRRMLPFDEFRVVAISGKRRHLRRIFSTDPSAERRYPFKWWPMPEFLLKTIDDEQARTIDIAEMFSDPDYAAMAENDPATKAYRESGVRYSLSVPIYQGDRIAAFIGLDTKTDQPYDSQQLALCQRLPLSQAVLMALHFEEEDKLHACVELVRELGKQASDVFRVAQTLTERLAMHFGWDHVAVFQHDEDKSEFRVLSQSSGSDRTMDPDLVIPNDRGIVADAFRTQNEINIPDIAAHAAAQSGDARPEYVEGISGMASELAMPIPGETKRWVLNVESRFSRAFADEEVDTLRLLAVEAGHILERTALLEMRDSILKSINDAVIETDRRCIIRRANPAAVRILGCSESELAGMSLEQFIADTQLASAIAETDVFSRHEVEIVSSRGGRVWTLLSGAPLPKNLGGRVFVASDLTYEREVQKLGALKDVFRNASLESRLPLALAAGWLGQLCHDEPKAASTIERVLKQIRKADLPLERLLRLATPDTASLDHHSPVDLYSLIAEVLSELPESDLAAIVVAPGRSQAFVRAPREDLRFCLESALSFALRTRPQDQSIKVSVTTTRKTAAISMLGNWAPDLGPEEPVGIRRRWRRQTVSDLALATGEIESILMLANGRFRSQLDDRVRFELELPVAAQE